MNKILIKICLLLIGIQLSDRLLSQTVFDYSTFSTSQCNAFYPSVIINSSTHTTTCGTVQYDNIGHGITLDNNVISSFNYGTEFKLSFNFKQYYSYTIKVSADAIIGTSSDPWPKLRIDVNSASNGTGAFCNGPESINTTTSLNSYNNQLIAPGSFTDYTFNIPSLSSAMSFLYVGSLPQLYGSSSTIEINKITITEIPPPVSFTLPASTTFECGTTTPQIFTVTNVYGTTGITNYTWNLGSASNNWLYNGSPASQTISTGTTGSISLTPVCGAVQTNVYATVTANGNTYNTNTSSISYSTSAATISGSDAFCTGTSSYQVNGLPCSTSTVVWSVSPTGIVSFNANANPVILTQEGNGAITLTATITDACSSSPVTLTKSIYVGTPGTAGTYNSPSNSSEPLVPIPHWNLTQFNPACIAFRTNIPVAAGSTATWYGSVDPGVTWYQTVNNAFCNFTAVGQMATLTVNITNSCGTSSASYRFKCTTANSCGIIPMAVGGGAVSLASDDDGVLLAPNPANNMLQVSLKETKGKTVTRNISGIEVFDKLGNKVLSLKYGQSQATVHLDISTLNPDVYMIKVFDGQSWTTKKFIKQ